MVPASANLLVVLYSTEAASEIRTNEKSMFRVKLR